MKAWFDFDMTSTYGHPMFRYAWPSEPEVRGLAHAIQTIQGDLIGFYQLLATTTWDDVHSRIAQQYSLDVGDVHALLDEPLLHLPPSRPPER